MRIVLPEEVLPSKDEIPFDELDFSSIPEGFQPDMDPRLREALEALDDDAYVDNDVDDYFDKLNAEKLSDDDGDDDKDNYDDYEDDEDDEDGNNWEIEFRKYLNHKNKTSKGNQENKEKDDKEEDKRSRTTGYSLTSSIMYRNEKLKLLDDQFEKVNFILSHVKYEV